LTKGILIGKGYVYCFSTPGGINHRATSSSDIMGNKIPVTLQTIGAIPNNQNILKVTWFSSNATKKTYQFAILLESYMLIVLRFVYSMFNIS
jgi:hypothetical protein